MINVAKKITLMIETELNEKKQQDNKELIIFDDNDDSKKIDKEEKSDIVCNNMESKKKHIYLLFPPWEINRFKVDCNLKISELFKHLRILELYNTKKDFYLKYFPDEYVSEYGFHIILEYDDDRCVGEVFKYDRENLLHIQNIKGCLKTKKDCK